MLVECKEFSELFDIYYKFKSQIEPEPCCLHDCCEGMGDCGIDCCNEDGNKPMGTCSCHEESKDYEPCNDELLKKLAEADEKLTNHRDKSGCEICTKNKEAKL
mgnify:CR=1 FL=1